MNVVALVVAVVSALCAVYAVWYARRQAAAADRSAVASERSAVAAEEAVALEASRRHAELTPRFRVTADCAVPAIEGLTLTVFLAGPPELGRLDALTVSVRDDEPWRGKRGPLAGGPSPEQVAAQVWGPYEFAEEADPTGHAASPEGLPVGESLRFSMQATWPPRWSGQRMSSWRSQVGTVLRLQLDCVREGSEPWTLACELDTADESVTVEVP